jgi:hypothetical protein
VADIAPVRARRPAPITLAAVVLIVLAALQVVVASLFVTRQGELTAAVAALYPAASPDALADRIFAATAEGMVVHTLLTAVYLAAAWSLRTAGNAVRIFVTMLAVVATFTDGLILGQLPALLPNQATLTTGVLVLSTALRLVVAALLWLPVSARPWYSGGEASA